MLGKTKSDKTAEQLERFKAMSGELAVPEGATLDKAFGKLQPKKPAKPK